MMRSIYESFRGPTDRESIRPMILSKGAKAFTLLSCAKWDYRWNGTTEINRVQFVMSQSEFEKYKDYYISLVRTDAWFRVGNPIRLGTAQAKK